MFVATSISPKLAEGRQNSMLLEFSVPADCWNGTDISSVSQYEGEKEVLLPTYTALKVVSISEKLIKFEVLNNRRVEGFERNELELRTVPMDDPRHYYEWNWIAMADSNYEEEKITLEELYPVNNDRIRGLAIVIVNGTADSVQDACQRSGVRVLDFLTHSGYRVTYRENLSINEIMQVVTEISNRDHSEYDSFIFYFCGHGNEGVIFGDNAIDGKGNI
eukprot:TRINITY_DN4816_c0_g1_i1.p1 TRINITY_DN4816_c0_g1~~TRINITY_DN4816_c0_g1_i1.p1  ORF type:complete len:219 (-),score=22.62 TRINITY_DN4816_c0_g1_i1:13-669(-)